MWDYSEKLMEHFFNPKNMGSLKDADAVGETGSISCGDALKLFLKIKDNKIIDAKFQTFGCGSAIASSSILTEMVKGKDLDEALKISNQDIADELGGLPVEKMHCSVMGKEALDAAIANYRGDSTKVHNEEEEGPLICHCFGIHKNKIYKTVVENKLKTVKDVINYTKAGGGCSTCHSDIQDIIDDAWKKDLKAFKEEKEKNGEPEKVEKVVLTNAQKIMKIYEVIEKDINPKLAMDGGSAELVDLVNNIAKIKLHGACSTCPAGKLTLKNFVQRVLQEKTFPGLEVEEVK